MKKAPLSNSRELPPSMQRLLVQLHTRLLKGAAALQQWTSHFPVKTQKWILLCFCVLGFSASVGMVLQRPANNNRLFRLPAPLPTLRVQPETNKTRPLSPGILLRMHHFKQDLDSIAQDLGSDRMADSFLRARPRILDTLRYLDSLYLNKQYDAYAK